MPSGKASGKARAKGLSGWTRQELLEEVRRLRVKVGEAHEADIPRFTTKQSIVDELYRLYNEKDVPWAKRTELLIMIAKQEHGMFMDGGKGKESSGMQFSDFFKKIGTGQLEAELAGRAAK